MGSHVLVLEGILEQHVLSILMIAALLHVLMAAVLMSLIPTPVYATLAGQALTVPSILMTVVHPLAFMEDLAL